MPRQAYKGIRRFRRKRELIREKMTNNGDFGEP
jgi:hypothetical protein